MCHHGPTLLVGPQPRGNLMYRSPVNRKASHKAFRTRNTKTAKANTRSPLRGGIRL